VLEPYLTAFLDYLEKEHPQGEPDSLYTPSTYILGLGGKRVRPVLTLMATDICQSDFRAALPAALAVEVFHNFSLVHDDIMDAAPLRRGKPTVHQKWDVNTGILSGDAMLIAAYRYFEGYPPVLFKPLVSSFSQMAIQVCEGQQMDIDFPKQQNVQLPEYLKMITYKTAVLLGCALELGARIGGATDTEAAQWNALGQNLGIAFQLQDDYLDTFGQAETFGKQIGGDIIENKKTFLYLFALKQASAADQKQLMQWYTEESTDDSSQKIKAVKTIFTNCGADTAIRQEIENYTQKAFGQLTSLPYNDRQLKPLHSLATALLDRTT